MRYQDVSLSVKMVTACILLAVPIVSGVIYFYVDHQVNKAQIEYNYKRIEQVTSFLFEADFFTQAEARNHFDSLLAKLVDCKENLRLIQSATPYTDQSRSAADN